MAEPILTVEHLIKAYGETPVLDDISFAVKPGEVIVVVAFGLRQKHPAALSEWSGAHPERPGAAGQ